jgi:hypothetical protein
VGILGFICSRSHAAGSTSSIALEYSDALYFLWLLHARRERAPRAAAAAAPPMRVMNSRRFIDLVLAASVSAN